MSSWPLAVCVGLAVAMLAALVGVVERTPGGRDIEIAVPDDVAEAPPGDVLSLSSEGALAPEFASRHDEEAGAGGGASVAAATSTETSRDLSDAVPKVMMSAPRTAARTTSEAPGMAGAPTDRFAVSAPNASRDETVGLARSGVKAPERAEIQTGSIDAADGASPALAANIPSGGAPGDAEGLPRSVIEPPKRGTVEIEGALSIGGAPVIAASPRAVQSPRRHVVARGQTLWVISRSHYGSGVHYRRLYRLNRARIGHPDRIYPGQVLLLPDIETVVPAPDDR